MTQRKKLIEVALPLEAINEASTYEKKPGIGAHPRGLHQWWARRPFVAARAVIFTSLVDDPDDPDAPPEFVEACRKLRKGTNASVEDTPRQRLFDFIEALVQWGNSTDEKILETARELIRLSTDGNPPPLLDPFAGGGAIPLEGQRLGLETYASDLNPVAVMINKALIEIPPYFADMAPVNPRDLNSTAQGMSWKGSQGLASDLRYYGERVQNIVQESIGMNYPTGPNGEMVIAWLWARTVACPNPACNAITPLVRSFIIGSSNGKPIWLRPEVNSDTKQISFSVQYGKEGISQGSMGRNGGTCLVCGSPIPFDHIRAQGKDKKLGAQLLAIACKGSSGREYYAPTQEHEEAARIPFPDIFPNTSLPEQALGFRIQAYGIQKHYQLFTARQLVALNALSNAIKEIQKEIERDALHSGLARNENPLREGASGARAYSEALVLYLAFALSRVSNFNNSMTKWVASNAKIMPVFSRQAISMTWDYGEANILQEVVGGWPTCIGYIADCIDTLSAKKPGFAFQMDAANPTNVPSQMLVSTDPPYYDNISYSDLSDFFYIWLRENLKEVYPDIFGTLLVPKDAEIIASPPRFNGSRARANEHFERGLKKAFQNLRQITSSDFPLTTFYAFKETDSASVDQDANRTGWEYMLESLIQAGFCITGTWPIRTESTIALKTELNFLASSIVLVCRPRPDDAPQTSRREFVNALRRELPKALREMQSGSIAPVDLAQASIGPGMAIYSRYSRVLEADGSPLTVRTALQLINQELDAFLAETEGDVDADTRFCINWFEQFGFKEDEFGRADVLARAKNTSVDGLVNAGVIAAGAGKVRLRSWQEVDAGWTPQEDKRVTVWECVHHLIERINTHGESGAAALLMRMHSDLAAEAKMLAYRLYQICDRKGWAEYALEYNALVLSWPRLQEVANELKQNQPPEQLGLF